jgi:hypothetical protein
MPLMVGSWTAGSEQHRLEITASDSTGTMATRTVDFDLE